MSSTQYFLDLDLTTPTQTPTGLFDLLKLDWLYTSLEPFFKPSPDQAIELQKSQGKRVQFLAKGSSKPSASFALLLTSPFLKPVFEPKQELPIIHNQS